MTCSLYLWVIILIGPVLQQSKAMSGRSVGDRAKAVFESSSKEQTTNSKLHNIWEPLTAAHAPQDLSFSWDPCCAWSSSYYSTFSLHQQIGPTLDINHYYRWYYSAPPHPHSVNNTSDRKSGRIIVLKPKILLIVVLIFLDYQLCRNSRNNKSTMIYYQNTDPANLLCQCLF